MARKKLGELLIDAGVLDPTGLRAALAEQRRWGKPLGRTLVEMRVIDEASLVSALSSQLAVEAIDLDKIRIHRTVIDLVPRELAYQHNLIPFDQPMKFLDVAMSDPTNMGIIDELRIRTQLNIRPFIAGPWMIERALIQYYSGSEIEISLDDLSEPPRRQPGATQPPPSRHERVLPRPTVTPPNRDAEIDALQQRLSRVEALLERDQQVLRTLLALLVDKGVATRDEIVERLK